MASSMPVPDAMIQRHVVSILNINLKFGMRRRRSGTQVVRENWWNVATADVNTDFYSFSRP